MFAYLLFVPKHQSSVHVSSVMRLNYFPLELIACWDVGMWWGRQGREGGMGGGGGGGGVPMCTKPFHSIVNI